jgi:hypothetical protein
MAFAGNFALYLSINPRPSELFLANGILCECLSLCFAPKESEFAGNPAVDLSFSPHSGGGGSFAGVFIVRPPQKRWRIPLCSLAFPTTIFLWAGDHSKLLVVSRGSFASVFISDSVQRDQTAAVYLSHNPHSNFFSIHPQEGLWAGLASRELIYWSVKGGSIMD